MSRNKIWVIDDDRAMRWVLEKTFKEEGFDVTSFEEAQSALDQLSLDAPDVILTDIRMPGIDGLTFLAKVKANYPDLPVIIMTAHSDLESAVSSYQTGAFEYLPKPFDIDEALALVNRAILHIKNAATRIGKNGTTDSIDRNHWRVSCYAGSFPRDWSFVSITHYSVD
jgi:two-component system nitrogen regulation response regulator GlnG